MLIGVAASAQVTHVEPVSANYANKTVSFRVWWNAGSRDATHLSKVWVWVDYITVNSNNTTSGNTWTRAAVSAASPTASVSYDGSNRQGFWLQGATSGSYSATVTVQLNITETKFNWCAYVSDCPPNATFNNGTYTLHGTPPFVLTAANGTTSQTVTATTITASAITITPVWMTDKTACPWGFCPYVSSDLYVDASHVCKLRPSGAQNWEAWITDSRDSKLYRIVYMPDNKWWLAQNLDYRSENYKCGINQTAYCDKYGIMLKLTNVIPTNICPDGWTLPTMSQIAAIASTKAQVRQLRSTTTWLGSTDSFGSPGTDYYGFTILATGYVDDENGSCYDSEGYASYLILYPTNNTAGVTKPRMLSGYRPNTKCFNNTWSWGWSTIGEDNDWAYLRCYRPL